MYLDEWKGLSKHALKFTIKLLEKDVDKRLTPDDALKHKFINRKIKHEKINTELLERLAIVEKRSWFWYEMFMLFSTYLNKETMDEINKCFKQLDKEGSGLIKMSDVVKQI